MALAFGEAAFSHCLVATVGRKLVKLDGSTAMIAVPAEAMVLDFFSRTWNFAGWILPALPVSTSQALVGAVVGLGLARGIQNIKLRVLGKFVLSWIVTPLGAGILSFVVSRLVRELL